MPKLKKKSKKPVPKVKRDKSVPTVPAVIARVVKPEITNPRYDSLKMFVSQEQYSEIKKACSTVVGVVAGITLRRVWAVVDHLVAVNDGRENEIQYATNSKTINADSNRNKSGKPSPRPMRKV